MGCAEAVVRGRLNAKLWDPGYAWRGVGGRCESPWGGEGREPAQAASGARSAAVRVLPRRRCRRPDSPAAAPPAEPGPARPPAAARPPSPPIRWSP